MSGEGKSVRWIVNRALILIAWVGWGYMAGSWAASTHADGIVVGRGRIAGIGMILSAIYTFVKTSIVELPNFFQVVIWHLKNRIWIPLLFTFLEIGIIVGGYYLKKLEDEMANERKRRW